jgi:hypothetical protein
MTNKPPASKPTALKLVSSKTKPREGNPPLDDQRWRPLIAEHKRLAEHQGNPDLAANDMTMALLNGRLHCKWRNIPTLSQDLMPPAFWADHRLSCGPEGVRVTLRPPRDDTDVVLVRSQSLVERLAQLPKPAATPPLSPEEEARRNKILSEMVFYVWEPDIDALWPSMAAYARKPEPEIDERRKPGKRITKNWKLHVAGELHRIIIVEGKPPPTATEIADFCSNKLKHYPDIRSIQRLLRALL